MQPNQRHGNGSAFATPPRAHAKPPPADDSASQHDEGNEAGFSSSFKLAEIPARDLAAVAAVTRDPFGNAQNSAQIDSNDTDTGFGVSGQSSGADNVNRPLDASAVYGNDQDNIASNSNAGGHTIGNVELNRGTDGSLPSASSPTPIPTPTPTPAEMMVTAAKSARSVLRDVALAFAHCCGELGAEGGATGTARRADFCQIYLRHGVLRNHSIQPVRLHHYHGNKSHVFLLHLTQWVDGCSGIVSVCFQHKHEDCFSPPLCAHPFTFLTRICTHTHSGGDAAELEREANEQALLVAMRGAREAEALRLQVRVCVCKVLICQRSHV